MLFRSLAFFSLTAAVLSAIASPADIEGRSTVTDDNIVYVTSSAIYWYALSSIPLVEPLTNACAYPR